MGRLLLLLMLLTLGYLFLRSLLSSRRAFDRRMEREGARRKETTRPADDEEYYAAVLGLEGDRSAAAVKKAYHEALLKYHPDRVEHLGKEFREIAEEKSKLINKAYRYFEQRGLV